MIIIENEIWKGSTTKIKDLKLHKKMRLMGWFMGENLAFLIEEFSD
jgi:hypothetical protein